MVIYEADVQENGEVKEDFDSTMTSLFSEAWRRMAEEAMEAFVGYFMHHPVYADHIVAYHIGGGESDEWFHFGYREGGLRRQRGRAESLSGVCAPEIWKRQSAAARRLWPE